MARGDVFMRLSLGGARNQGWFVGWKKQWPSELGMDVLLSQKVSGAGGVRMEETDGITEETVEA